MQIRSDARIFLCAKTGAGKTTFAKTSILPIYPGRVVFWDIKRQNTDFPHTALCRTPLELSDAIKINHQKILYQPSDISENDFNKVCQIIFNTGNTCFYIDEVAYVCNSSRIEYWHKQLYIVGRGLGIGVITCTQRPIDISNFCISESEHFFVGRLQLEGDVKKIAPMIPREHRDVPLTIPYYHFMYTDTENVIFLPPVKI